MYGVTGDLSAICQRFGNGAARARDLRDRASGTRQRPSQVNVLAARVQSCICWPSETRAAGHARCAGAHFGQFAGKFSSCSNPKFSAMTQIGTG